MLAPSRFLFWWIFGLPNFEKDNFDVHFVKFCSGIRRASSLIVYYLSGKEELVIHLKYLHIGQPYVISWFYDSLLFLSLPDKVHQLLIVKLYADHFIVLMLV